MMIHRAFIFLLTLAMALPVPAADLPDLGDVAASDFSPAEERRIGEEIMREIWRDPAYVDDPEIEEYINRLGQKLVAVAQHTQQDFNFFVVEDSTLNAFALPGGNIGVHTGLIIATESESELASVLAHEIGHVTQRHIAQIIGKQGQSSMLVLASVLVAVLAARSNSDVSGAAIAAGQAGALQSQLSYSRLFERDADREGLQTLNAAGFDVRGMPSFFERLQRSTRLYENNAPAYLRTHPLTSERIADMENRAVSMPYRQVLDSNDFRFVRAKLRAQQGLPQDAVRAMTEYTGQVAKNDFAAKYGLVRAYLRAGSLKDAQAGLDALRKVAPPSPFVEILAGEIALARKDWSTAVAGLERSRSQFPDSISLQYALADAQIQAGKSAAALETIKPLLQRRQNDRRLWQLTARANADLGKQTAQHRAQAELYALIGSWQAAVEQLEIALKANDGDFYEMSSLDARLRELRARMIDEKRNRK